MWRHPMNCFQNCLTKRRFTRNYWKRSIYRCLFFALDDTKVELIQPVSEKSTVHKYLENKGEGIHHVAFEVEDIYAEMERLKSEGFQPLTEKPYVGALNKLVCFFHPKTTNGVLVELCQKVK
jgi:methylmalonyl-CoA/ethylmalonyl-CoA epimerase